MKSTSGTKIYNPKIHHQLTQGCISNIIREHNNKNRAITKLINKNSTREKVLHDGRVGAQQLDKTKKLVASNINNEVATTVNSLIDFISTELNITEKSKKKNNYIQPNVSFEQIQQIMNDCLPVLKQLRTICYDSEIQKYVRCIKSTNYKKSLFDRLIDLDARFALFALKDSLKDATLNVDSRFEMLSKDMQFELKALKEKLSINEDLDYVATTAVAETNEKNQTVDLMVKNLNQTIFKSKEEVANATKILSDGLYAYIVEQLQLKDFDEDKKQEEISEVLAMCRQGINSLKQTSENKNLSEIAGWEDLNPHTELFNRLINLNIRFVFFAPRESLNRLDIDFKRLNEQERNEFQKVLIDYGLWDDDKFYENYKDLFGVEKQI